MKSHLFAHDVFSKYASTLLLSDPTITSLVTEFEKHSAKTLLQEFTTIQLSHLADTLNISSDKRSVFLESVKTTLLSKCKLVVIHGIKSYIAKQLYSWFMSMGGDCSQEYDSAKSRFEKAKLSFATILRSSVQEACKENGIAYTEKLEILKPFMIGIWNVMSHNPLEGEMKDAVRAFSKKANY